MLSLEEVAVLRCTSAPKGGHAMRLQHSSLANGCHKRRLSKNILDAVLALGLSATAFAPQAKAPNVRRLGR